MPNIKKVEFPVPKQELKQRRVLQMTARVIDVRCSYLIRYYKADGRGSCRALHPRSYDRIWKLREGEMYGLLT